jgi:predicted RNA-binding Zn-ribbon protein involved in translation (DUF1610 family)
MMAKNLTFYSCFQVQKYLKYCIETDKELTCPDCGEDFDNPSALVKHLALKHYADTLKQLFKFTGNCLSCKRELGSVTQMLTHMALKHAVLYKASSVF